MRVAALTMLLILAAPGAASAQVFENGMAQAAFTAPWVTGEVWVESQSDSDRDGRLDRIHVNFNLPRETQTGLDVPVIYEDSPYFAATGAASNWLVDHELGAQPPARDAQAFFPGTNTSPNISNDYEAVWLPRGFGVVHSESPGTGHSDGCPTSGGPNETAAAKAVIDWLNQRAPAYTTRTGTALAPAVDWHNGRAAMIGVSYNGTLPIGAASTGVEGLKAIVPISAISDWYGYYRENGLVRAPHSAEGGRGTNAFQGEDLDVLADVVYSRRDEGNPRTICRPVIDELTALVARDSGDRTAVWRERAYDLTKIEAATLVAHGGNDFNVMTEQAARLYAALRSQGTPHAFYFHQDGHGGDPPDFLLNLWFTRYLWNQANGVENLARSWVVREAAFCPPRATTVTAEASGTAQLTVASTAPFRVGLTLTIPQGNGTTTRVIKDIPDATHLTLATAVPQRVDTGATVDVRCGPDNPSPYAEWPDPAAADTVMRMPAGPPETFTDDARVADTALLGTSNIDHRLLYVTEPLTENVRISGAPRVSLRVAFSKPRANVTAALVSLPGSGSGGTILTRGWIDPENRTSDATSEPVSPGTFYTLSFAMQPKDTIVASGRRLALMVFSSDRQYTLRPAPGTQITLDPAESTLTLPMIGRLPQVPERADPPGAPASLGLALGPEATFGTFVPGVAREYVASTVAFATGGVLSVGGGRLANGTATLPQPLRISLDPSGAATFRQSIGASDTLRTGAYSARVTFTVTAATP